MEFHEFIHLVLTGQRPQQRGPKVPPEALESFESFLRWAMTDDIVRKAWRTVGEHEGGIIAAANRLASEKPAKSAAEILQDNQDLPAGAKQHLQAWAQGLIGDQPHGAPGAAQYLNGAGLNQSGSPQK